MGRLKFVRLRFAKKRLLEVRYAQSPAGCSDWHHLSASCWAILERGSDNSVVHAQEPTGAAAAASTDPAVFRSETRLVLVDTVVTDKKGNYIRDLAQKDFKVWEDGKEQPVSSFSFEESTGVSDARPRYMVLFFDNSTMNMGDQVQARAAAAKFIDANAGPDRLIAIADFGGTVH